MAKSTADVVSNKKIEEIDLENFCFYPFTQMLLQPNGNVAPCCWNQAHNTGVMPRDTVMQIWNGQAARDLRREFLAGKPKSCQQQMRHIGCHRWSRRNSYDGVVLSEIQEKPPQRFDVRLNGKCNLECVMCNVWKQPNGLYDESDFWISGPEHIFPYLKEMDVLGGEPFVQKDTFRLIDEISKVNSACTWAFVTNGHYSFNNSIQQRLDKISIRWMQVSVDAMTQETYQKIRVKGQLERVLTTVNRLNEYQIERSKLDRGFRIIVSMCVQQDNWKEIGAFLKFAYENMLEPVFQFAYDPTAVSLLNLSKEEQLEICRFFTQQAQTYGEAMLKPILMPLVEALSGYRGVNIES